MRGNIEQRGPNRWRLRVFVGRVNDRPKLVTRSFQGSKRQAESALAKFVSEVESGQVARGHVPSVAEHLDTWLEDIASTRSGYTMKEHRRCIEHDIKPALGSVRLDKLTARQLDGFYHELLARDLSPSSVRRFHSILHASLARAVKWGLIPDNKADRATPPSLVSKTVTAPELMDIQRLIREAERDKPVLAAAIALAAVTGARRGELCALQWSDVDWSRQRLAISRSLTDIDGIMKPGPTKTHQQRYIALDDTLLALLNKRHSDQEAYATAVGVELVEDPFILSPVSNGGKAFKPDTLTTDYTRLAKKLGLDTHFHELRHFTATTAVASGTDIRTVSGRLGHADPSVTLKVYAHAIEDRDRDLARLLGTAVLGTVKLPPELDKAHDPAPPELHGTRQLTPPG